MRSCKSCGSDMTFVTVLRNAKSNVYALWKCNTCGRMLEAVENMKRVDGSADHKGSTRKEDTPPKVRAYVPVRTYKAPPKPPVKKAAPAKKITPTFNIRVTRR